MLTVSLLITAVLLPSTVNATSTLKGYAVDTEQFVVDLKKDDTEDENYSNGSNNITLDADTPKSKTTPTEASDVEYLEFSDKNKNDCNQGDDDMCYDFSSNFELEGDDNLDLELDLDEDSGDNYRFSLGSTIEVVELDPKFPEVKVKFQTNKRKDHATAEESDGEYKEEEAVGEFDVDYSDDEDEDSEGRLEYMRLGKHKMNYPDYNLSEISIEEVGSEEVIGVGESDSGESDAEQNELIKQPVEPKVYATSSGELLQLGDKKTTEMLYGDDDTIEDKFNTESKTAVLYYNGKKIKVTIEENNSEDDESDEDN